MSGNFAIKGGGVGPLMANAILNFHFDFLTPSLTLYMIYQKELTRIAPKMCLEYPQTDLSGKKQ